MKNLSYGLGFGIIPMFVLFLGYLNIHPELYRSVPENFGEQYSSAFTSIAWDEEEAKNPPIEYVSDKFEAGLVWTEVANITSFWSLWNRPNSEMEYRWEYVVKNLSDQKRAINVTYKLVDENGEELSSSYGSETAEPGETVTIRGTEMINWNMVPLVDDRDWSIGNNVTY